MGAAPGRSEIDQDQFLRRSRGGRFCHAHPVSIQPPRRGCPVAVGGVDGGPVGYRGRGRVRAWSPGRADPTGSRTVRRHSMRTQLQTRTRRYRRLPPTTSSPSWAGSRYRISLLLSCGRGTHRWEPRRRRATLMPILFCTRFVKRPSENNCWNAIRA